MGIKMPWFPFQHLETFDPQFTKKVIFSQKMVTSGHQNFDFFPSFHEVIGGKEIFIIGNWISEFLPRWQNFPLIEFFFGG